MAAVGAASAASGRAGMRRVGPTAGGRAGAMTADASSIAVIRTGGSQAPGAANSASRSMNSMT
ncbi:hypothetical protein NCG97_27305 [Streptomyces lydicamycinicus]|nr:hypothetical protein NCG97_27305 [Streptomyces lydicamycinicus]